MFFLISLIIVDSSNFSFSRPISIKIYKDKIYVLEIIGNLWIMEDLKSEPILLLKGLNQPSYDIEIIKDTIFIAHEGIISKFYKKKLEHIITNLPRYEVNSTIKLTKDTIGTLFIAVKDKIYKLYNNNLNLIISGFYEPIKLRIDEKNKLWGIFKIDEDNSGLFPLYENINYSDLEPIIKFNLYKEPTSFIILKDKFLISFKDGTILEYTKFRDIFKSKVIFKSDLQISDFDLYKNYFYIIDFSGGRIYKLKWKIL